MKSLKSLFFFSNIAGVLSFIYLVYNTNEEFLAVLYTLCVFAGFFMYREKYERSFFFLSLNIALFLLPFLTYSYIQQTGHPFIPGGDAQTYYEKIREIYNGNFTQYIGRYKLYLFIGWKFYQIINVFTNSLNPIYIVFLNLFVCANISPLLYKVGKGLFKNNVLIYACLMTSLFPMLIQVADGTWREGLVYAPFLYSIYLSMNLKTAKHLILFFIIFLFIINIRMEIGIVSILFLISYNYFFENKNTLENREKSNKYIYGFILLGAIVYCLYLGLFEYLNYSNSASIEYQMDVYREKSNELSDATSISNILRNSGVIGNLILFIYTLFSPLPPPLFASQTILFHNVFISIAAIIWYFVLPFSLMGLIRNIKRENLSKITKSFLVILFVSTLIISLTTVGTARHKLYLYPIMFLYYFDYIFSSSKRQIIKQYSIVTIVYIIAFLGYSFIK